MPTTLHVNLPPQMQRRFMALALANTRGNRSELVAQLINRASMFPSEFSLITPADAGITEEDIDAALARYSR